MIIKQNFFVRQHQTNYSRNDHKYLDALRVRLRLRDNASNGRI
jgi:hypothetical protein